MNAVCSEGKPPVAAAVFVSNDYLLLVNIGAIRWVSWLEL